MYVQLKNEICYFLLFMASSNQTVHGHKLILVY